MHEDKGVKFIHGSASEFIGYDGKLREVVVQNGEKIPADICVVGAGKWSEEVCSPSCKLYSYKQAYKHFSFMLDRQLFFLLNLLVYKI